MFTKIEFLTSHSIICIRTVRVFLANNCNIVHVCVFVARCNQLKIWQQLYQLVYVLPGVRNSMYHHQARSRWWSYCTVTSWTQMTQTRNWPLCLRTTWRIASTYVFMATVVASRRQRIHWERQGIMDQLRGNKTRKCVHC